MQLAQSFVLLPFTLFLYDLHILCLEFWKLVMRQKWDVCVSQQQKTDPFPNIFCPAPPIARSENAIFAIVEYCNGNKIIVLNFRNVLDFHWHVVRIEYQFRQITRAIAGRTSIMCHWEQGCSNTEEETKIVVFVFLFSKIFLSFSIFGYVGIYDEPEKALPLRILRSTLISFCLTHPHSPVQDILTWQITCSVVSNQSSSSSIFPTTRNTLELTYEVTLCLSTGFTNRTWTHKALLERPCPWLFSYKKAFRWYWFASRKAKQSTRSSDKALWRSCKKR